MKTLIYLLLFVACVFCSCNKDENVETKTDDNNSTAIAQDDEASGTMIFSSQKGGYIQVYIDADTVYAVQRGDIGVDYPCLYVHLDGAKYDDKGDFGYDNYARQVSLEAYMYDNGIGSFPVGYVTPDGEVHSVDTEELKRLVNENKDVFKKYNEQLGDTTYPNANMQVPYGHVVVVNKILGINVVCNEDFDQNHPKGSSVTDILTFYGSSPVDYIKRGYQWGERIFDNLPKGVSYVYELITCNAADIQEKNVEFYDDTSFLYFDQLPATPGEYSFDVTIKFADKELKNTVSMTF